MKSWQLIIIALLLCFCVAGAVASTETFQGRTQFSYSISSGRLSGSGSAPLYVSYNQPTNNENWYFTMSQDSGGSDTNWWGLTIINPLSPNPFDYFAFTNVYWDTSRASNTWVNFYDSSGTYLTQSSAISSYLATYQGGRFELIRNPNSGSIHLFVNGTDEGQIAVSTTRPSICGFYDTAPNGYYSAPSYHFNIDDIIQGVGQPTQIVGTIPASWYIKKDMLGQTTSGLYNQYNATVRSTYFTSTYGSGSNLNTQLQLVDSSGTVWETTPITGYAGSAQLNLADFTASNAPFGLYQVRIGGTAIFDNLWYVGTGASVTWDKSIYGQGDTATISYTISPSYYNTQVYNYHLAIINVYGNIVGTNTTLSTASGSVTQSLNSNTYPQGVYYAEVIANLVGGGSDIIMNYASAQVTGYIYFNGYVMNAETGAVLSGANINVTQSTSTATSTSLAGGIWNSSNNWLSGSLFTINTTKSGYTQDLLSFTPLSAKTINLNISLIPSPATSTGVSIGGIVRDNVYSNPISGASVVVHNTTSGEYQTKTTNIAGYYRADNLYSGRLYDVWSSKTGYGNSTVAQKLAVGV